MVKTSNILNQFSVLIFIVVLAEGEHPNSFWSKRNIGIGRYEPDDTETVQLVVVPVREQQENKYLNINQDINEPLLKFLLKNWKINIWSQ